MVCLSASAAWVGLAAQELTLERVYFRHGRHPNGQVALKEGDVAVAEKVRFELRKDGTALHL